MILIRLIKIMIRIILLWLLFREIMIRNNDLEIAHD